MDNGERLKLLCIALAEFAHQQTRAIDGESILLEMEEAKILKEVNFPNSTEELIQQIGMAKRINFQKGKIEGQITMLEAFADFMQKKADELFYNE